MKPSELRGGNPAEMRPAAPDVPVNISRDAKPPITQKETEGAEGSVCRWHGGIIGRFPAPAQYGKVFFCPIGQQFWRYENPEVTWGSGKKMTPIKLSNAGIV
jgi:hypothetical protein